VGGPSRSLYYSIRHIYARGLKNSHFSHFFYLVAIPFTSGFQRTYADNRPDPPRARPRWFSGFSAPKPARGSRTAPRPVRSLPRFRRRIDAPVLTDIELDCRELAEVIEADELYPKQVRDLFSVQPAVVKGRFKPGRSDASGTITIRGNASEGRYVRKVAMMLPAKERANAVLAQQWARAKVDELMSQDLAGAQRGKPDPAIKETIVGLGITYRLMTQYTSFVAVEAKTVTVAGQPRKVEVPVEMPEGMSYEGIFGPRGGRRAGARGMALARLGKSPVLFSARCWLAKDDAARPPVLYVPSKSGERLRQTKASNVVASLRAANLATCLSHLRQVANWGIGIRKSVGDYSIGCQKISSFALPPPCPSCQSYPKNDDVDHAGRFRHDIELKYDGNRILPLPPRRRPAGGNHDSMGVPW